VLESLIRHLRLTRLELEVFADEPATICVESNTLTDLRIYSKKFLPSRLACPELTACSIDGYNGTWELNRKSPQELYSMLFEGCPRLQCIVGLDKFRRNEQ